MSARIRAGMRRFCVNSIHPNGGGESVNRLCLHLFDDEDGLGPALEIEHVEDPKDYRNLNSTSDPIEALVERFFEVAQSAADGEGDTCKFVIKAEWNEPPEKERPEQSPIFKVEPSKENSRDMPNERGVLGMMMRHIECKERILQSTTQATLVFAAEAMKSMRQENAELRSQAYENEKLRQDLLDRTHERQLKAKNEERHDERMAMLMANVQALAPLLLGKVAGISKLGASAVKLTPQYQTIKGIVDGATPEQMASMADWLKSFPGTVGQKKALEETFLSIIASVTNESEEDVGKTEPSWH